MPRLSYLIEAMPWAASASASSLYELFLPFSSGEFPSRSVGPEPAMISTTGTFRSDDGTSRVPEIVPVAVERLTDSPAAAWSAVVPDAGFWVFSSAVRTMSIVSMCASYQPYNPSRTGTGTVTPALRLRRRMLTKTLAAALLVALIPTGAAAQPADPAIAAATKAMGAEGLTSITYSGSASTGNFGQSKTIAGPLAITTISNYTRSIDLNQPASRATGATQPPTIPGAPPPQPGTFNQNITPANAAWTQQLEIWVTPWGFLKGAAANNATVKPQRIGGKPYNVALWSPAQKSPGGKPYTLTGYINDQNLVERVETWVEHPVMADLSVDTSYENYQDFGGVKVPGKITQKRAGLVTFEATITNAGANPANIAELLTPPAAQGRGGAPGGAPAPAPPAVESQKLADGVY